MKVLELFCHPTNHHWNTQLSLAAADTIGGSLAPRLRLGLAHLLLDALPDLAGTIVVGLPRLAERALRDGRHAVAVDGSVSAVIRQFSFFLFRFFCC